ncbi:hypothetical protein ABMA27_001336 [Loxostege sticticalis]|uniref:FLYWCH-type domain-containing protein n=1 Tax=Loxostege sticticalis TaxID=481309 RepID=A0ABR3HY39_LOXSC
MTLSIFLYILCFLILFKNYTFSQHGPSFRYHYCSKKRAANPCGAKLHMDQHGRIIRADLSHNHPPPRIMIRTMTKRHPLMLVQSYAFTITSGNDRYWHCNSKPSTGCTAKFRFNRSGVVVFQDLRHNHQPPKYFRTQDGEYFLRTPNSKKLLRFRNYTYSQTSSDGRYWKCCNKYAKGCGAKLRLNQHGKIVFSNLQHTHEPPVYYKTKDGTYIRA